MVDRNTFDPYRIISRSLRKKRRIKLLKMDQLDPINILEAKTVTEVKKKLTKYQEDQKEIQKQQKIELKIYRDQLDQLRRDATREQLSFPVTLSKFARKKLHVYAQSIGLKSRSTGKDENRFLTVYKKNVEPYIPRPQNSKTTRMKLTDYSIEQLKRFLAYYPVNDIDRANTILKGNSPTCHTYLPFNFGDSRTKVRLTVPPFVQKSKYMAARESLPTYEYRYQILTAINQYQVCVISGETGSGKTTQVPQYILEECAAGGKECRIICTQPRRLAATSIAERVASERNENIGNAIGYQIRLDSRVKSTTNLIFTTSGFLLRCLTGSKSRDVYKYITHLILDEVHEREKVTDFLLIAIRDALQENPHLKVILMSATLDSEMFSRYFGGCPVINVPGRLFEVETYHLAEILIMTDYKTRKMTEYMTHNKGPKILRAKKPSDDSDGYDDESDDDDEDDFIDFEDDEIADFSDDSEFDRIISQVHEVIANDSTSNKQIKKSPQICQSKEAMKKSPESSEKASSNEDSEFFDECLSDCMGSESDAMFEQIFYLISDENMPVDYLHSETARSALSIAAEKGLLLITEMLLYHGANPNLSDINGKTPLDYAKEMGNDDCYKQMEQHLKQSMPATVKNTITENDDEARQKALRNFTLAAYLSSFPSERDIDHELLYRVISYLHQEKSFGESILVFLPGYDDIMMQKEMIESRFKYANYELFVLHSGVNGMNNSEQNRVFERMPKGNRKIILSTNIAETSITINDVVHVIDLGKVKQQSYDSIGATTCLTSTAISKACAKQRAGRAGRIQNGFCYRLYTKEHYESMEMYTLPEILRVPLTEICLNAKMLTANSQFSIEDFLTRALQPPAPNNIRQSVSLLKQIDALDANEDITYLGIHLANMPVDCQLGKCILYAVLLKCLDPVVTIVSALSVKDPFLLPVGEEAKKVIQIKKTFSDNSLSDHYMLLNAFKQWKNAKNKGREFCQANMMCVGNMQMILGVKKLIMGHLQMAGFISEESTMRNSKTLNQNAERWDIIKACLTAGSYPNVCRLTPFSGKIQSKQDKKLFPHKSSVLCERKTRNQIDPTLDEIEAEWLIHGEKSRVTTFSLVKNITVIPSIDLVLFAGPIVLPDVNVFLSDFDECDGASNGDMPNWNFKIGEWNPNTIDSDIDSNMIPRMNALDLNASSESTFVIDDWIQFSMTTIEAILLLQLRQKFAAIFAKFLVNPVYFSLDHPSANVLYHIFDILQREDTIERGINGVAQTDIANDSKWFDTSYWTNPITNVKSHNQPAQSSNFNQNQPAICSNAYLNAIQPENRRNPKKKGRRGKKEQKRVQNRVRSNQCNGTSSNASNQKDDLPRRRISNDGERLDIIEMDPTAEDDDKNYRYFILMANDVDAIRRTVQNNLWKFKTPLSKIRYIQRNSNATIILFLYDKRSNNICGVAEFKEGKSNSKMYEDGFSLNMLIRKGNFAEIMKLDVDTDCELDVESGEKLLQKLELLDCRIDRKDASCLPLRRVSSKWKRIDYVFVEDESVREKTNRYFILIANRIASLSMAIYENVWCFRTSLATMRSIQTESPNAKIILFFFVKQSKSICAVGELSFDVDKSSECSYVINEIAKRRKFPDLFKIDVIVDCELEEEFAETLLNKAQDVVNFSNDAYLRFVEEPQLLLGRLVANDIHLEFVQSVKLTVDAETTTHRYFILMVSNSNSIPGLVGQRSWKLKTPLNKMRTIQKESPQAKIIIFFYVKDVIKCVGEFHGQRAYATSPEDNFSIDIIVEDKEFDELMPIDNVQEDCELEPDVGALLVEQLRLLASLGDEFDVDSYLAQFS